MKISDLFSEDKLQQYIDEGFISFKLHPSLPLGILNYTAQTQFDRKWDEITIACRGLIIDWEGYIVALPFEKFFNYDDTTSINFDFSGPVEVTDKMDGSLGIVCFYQNELVVATRGSFVSEMAVWAYNHISENYYSAFKTLCNAGITALVEIIYPDNRIVVDYGNFADVVLLGAYTTTGHWINAERVMNWPTPKTISFNVDSLEEALRLPARDNAEGVVVLFTNSGKRVKIKYDEYKELHRNIFGINRKSVWRWIMQGTLQYNIDKIPDEFYDYVMSTANELKQQATNILLQVFNDYKHVRNAMWVDITRAEIQQIVEDLSANGVLTWWILDGKLNRLNDWVWRSIEPFGAAK